MKLVKCSNNHYYDGDKYSECPHCARIAGGQAPSQDSMEKPSTTSPSKKLFSKGQSRSKSQSQSKTGQQDSKTSSMWDRESSEGSGTVSLHEAVNPDNTVGIVSAGEASLESPEKPHVEPPQPSLPAAGESAGIGSSLTRPPIGPLQAAINAVKEQAPSEDMKTMAFYNIDTSEPVVGWLVCTKGEYFGESFNLKTGRNMIGRSLKMDVPLAKEGSISRDRHAIIIFEPQKSKFYIQPGESNGLTYLNGDLLLLPNELHQYDKIQMGNAEFVFCPFCGELFSWNDYV